MKIKYKDALGYALVHIDRAWNMLVQAREGDCSYGLIAEISEQIELGNEHLKHALSLRDGGE